MLGTDIENKVKGITLFVSELCLILLSFLYPSLVVKNLKAKTGKSSGPFTFLTIHAFFGLKLWTFIFISFLVYNTPTYRQVSGIYTESTLPAILTIKDYIGVPAIDELIFLTVPYILISICLAWYFDKKCKKNGWEFEISPRDLMLYFAGFLILSIPIILILDIEWILRFSPNYIPNELSSNNLNFSRVKLIILLSLPIHLFMTLKYAAGKFWNTRKYFGGIFLWSLILPFTVFSGMVASLYISNKVLTNDENLLSDGGVNKYLPADLFKAKVIDTTHVDDMFRWDIIIKGNDTKNDLYEVLDKSGGFIFNEKNDTMCTISSIQGDRQFDSYNPGKLQVITSKPKMINSDYLFMKLSLFNKTEFNVPTQNIMIYSNGFNELNKSTKIGWLLQAVVKTGQFILSSEIPTIKDSLNTDH